MFIPFSLSTTKGLKKKFPKAQPGFQTLPHCSSNRSAARQLVARCPLHRPNMRAAHSAHDWRGDQRSRCGRSFCWLVLWCFKVLCGLFVWCSKKKKQPGHHPPTCPHAPPDAQELRWHSNEPETQGRAHPDLGLSKKKSQKKGRNPKKIWYLVCVCVFASKKKRHQENLGWSVCVCVFWCSKNSSN